MAIPRDIEVDSGPVFDDIELERELRAAMKGEPEIALFKTINRALRVKDELANTEAVRAILNPMWETVAEFFQRIVDADTLQGLDEHHEIVVLHKDMQANFRAVAAINQVFKESNLAEEQLLAMDQMQQEQEDTEE